MTKPMDEETKQKIEAFLKMLQDQLYHQKIKPDDFCTEMNITRQTLYNWFNGKSQMSLASYYKALDVIGATEEITTKEINL